MGIEFLKGISIAEAGLKGGMEKIVERRPPLLPDVGKDTFQSSSPTGKRVTGFIGNIANGIRRIFSGLGCILNECLLKPSQLLLKKVGIKGATREHNIFNGLINPVAGPVDKATEAIRQKILGDEKVIAAAQDFQKTFLRRAQDITLAHGTEAQKEAMRKIQTFQRDLETLHQAMPDDIQTFADLSEPARNHLRQMIFETLTSDLPELTEWGRLHGRAIGMTEEQIQKVIDKKGPPPPPAAAAAVAQAS